MVCKIQTDGGIRAECRPPELKPPTELLVQVELPLILPLDFSPGVTVLVVQARVWPARLLVRGLPRSDLTIFGTAPTRLNEYDL